MFGNVYFRDFPYKMVTHARVFSLEVITEINNKIGLYLQSSLSGLNKVYSYDNMCSYEKIKYDKILLPIQSDINDLTHKYNDDGQVPNWDYMEQYITKIENETMARVTKYFAEAGLDKLLAAEEFQVLSEERKYKEFKIGKMFSIVTGRDFIIGDTKEGNIPLVSHQNIDNGIVKYISVVKNRRLFNHETTISLADRGLFWATTQDMDFQIATRVKALSFFEKKSKPVMLYIVTAINMLQKRFEEYLVNATDKLPDLEISLPIQNDVTDPTYKYHEDGYVPDWDYMERYIDVLMRQTAARVKG